MAFKKAAAIDTISDADLRAAQVRCSVLGRRAALSGAAPAPAELRSRTHAAHACGRPPRPRRQKSFDAGMALFKRGRLDEALQLFDEVRRRRRRAAAALSLPQRPDGRRRRSAVAAARIRCAPPCR